MTYRILLDQLLKDCVQKGRVFEAAMGAGGQATTYVAAIRKEWQQAEDAYERILAKVMSGQVKLDEPVGGAQQPVPEPEPVQVKVAPRFDLPQFPALCYN